MRLLLVKMIFNKKFLMVVLLLMFGALLVVSVRAEEVVNDEVWLTSIKDSYSQGNENNVNNMWSSVDENRASFRRASLIDEVDSEEGGLKKLWDMLEKDNRESMFDILNENQRKKLWNNMEIRIEGTLGGVDNKKINENREELLKSLNYEQQRNMLGLILEENNGRAVKINWPKDSELGYENDIVSFSKNGKSFKASLKNTPGLIKIYVARDGTFEGDGEPTMFLSFDNDNMAALRDGSWIEREVEMDFKPGERLAVMNDEGSLLGYMDFGDSKNARVLYGTPAPFNGKEFEEGFHIWDEGHDGDGTRVDISINNEESMSVFPNALGKKDRKGFDYAFVSSIKDNNNVRGFYLDGNMQTKKVGMYGSEVYVSFDEDFEAPKGRKVVRFFDVEGVDGVKITGNADKISFTVKENSIIEADGKESVFVIKSKDGDKYYQHNFNERGLEQYVPNLNVDANYKDREGVERVSGSKSVKFAEDVSVESDSGEEIKVVDKGNSEWVEDSQGLGGFTKKEDGKEIRLTPDLDGRGYNLFRNGEFVKDSEGNLIKLSGDNPDEAWNTYKKSVMSYASEGDVVDKDVSNNWENNRGITFSEEPVKKIEEAKEDMMEKLGNKKSLSSPQEESYLPTYKHFYTQDNSGNIGKLYSGITVYNENNLKNPNAEVRIKFGAEWCGPCKSLDRQIVSMKDQNPNTAYVTIDIDRQPNLARYYGYEGGSIPQTTIWKGGKKIVPTKIGRW